MKPGPVSLGGQGPRRESPRSRGTLAAPQNWSRRQKPRSYRSVRAWIARAGQLAAAGATRAGGGQGARIYRASLRPALAAEDFELAHRVDRATAKRPSAEAAAASPLALSLSLSLSLSLGVRVCCSLSRGPAHPCTHLGRNGCVQPCE
jgi:hypothetical protein